MKKFFVAVSDLYSCFLGGATPPFYCCFSPAGSDYKDNSVNLMPFFTSSCFSGYGDVSKVRWRELEATLSFHDDVYLVQGFYAVYGAVLNRIADEESQYLDEGEAYLPVFGTYVMYVCVCVSKVDYTVTCKPLQSCCR